jgi:hypothetical protein
MRTALGILVTYISLSLIGCGGDDDDGTGGIGGSGTDADAHVAPDSGTATDTYLNHQPMTDCEGGKYDPDSNLCWQDPDDGVERTWDEAMAYCDSLDVGGQSDWRLPSINELRSLFRRGEDDACFSVEWSLEWTEAPADYCNVHDGCQITNECSGDDCDPYWCGQTSDYNKGSRGPGTDGCYWDAVIESSCGGDRRFWSSTSDPSIVYSDSLTSYWTMTFSRSSDLDFYSNIVNGDTANVEHLVRCVRNDS